MFLLVIGYGFDKYLFYKHCSYECVGTLENFRALTLTVDSFIVTQMLHRCYTNVTLCTTEVHTYLAVKSTDYFENFSILQGNHNFQFVYIV